MGVAANPKNSNNSHSEQTDIGTKREFYIEYNPYKNETKFLLDGDQVGGVFETYKRNFRLQQYLEKREGWNGLFAEISKKCNSGRIKVIFKGRDIDFADLKLCLEESIYADKTELEFIPAKKDFDDLMSGIGVIIDDIKNTEIDELKNNRRIEAAYREAINSQLKISVVATMSSGKSTLINSLIGKELLPSKNEACTATVARILDNDYAEEFNCVCRNKDEEIIDEKQNVTKEDLEAYNNQGAAMDNDDPNKIIFLDLDGPIPEVKSDKIRLLLMDTPGPNNSRDEKHKALTEDMIKDRKNSVILYVMNATQLRVDDDYKLLNLVSTAMKNGGKQTRDRFMFIINKFDALDLEKESSEDTIKKTRDYLSGFGIEQPNIFPVSAYAALLLRKQNEGIELSRKEASDFSKYLYDFGDKEYVESHFEKLADLSPSVRKKLESRLETADKYERAIIHTGIPAIEETINEYLEKYAYPIKVNDAASELSSLIRELDMQRRFNESIVNSKEKRDLLEQQIKDAKEKQKSAEKSKDDFNKRIDAFNIDDFDPNFVIGEATAEISRITDEFVGKGEVDHSKAEYLLKGFRKSIERLLDKYESRLKFLIENGLKEKGNKMSREYNEIVMKMFNDIEIEGFDFSNIRELDRYIIPDMDTLIYKNIRYEDIEEEYEIRNPERSGFWGSLKFWKPKKITKTRVIGQREIVDTDNIIIGEITDVENMLMNEINTTFKNAKDEVQKYKNIFKRNLNKLSEKIKQIIQDQEDKLKNVEELKSEIKNNEKKLAQIEKLADKINHIMEF